MWVSRLGHLLCVSLLCVVQVACDAAAADQGPMLDTLLRTQGWTADWAGPGGSGVTEIVFERRSDKVVAKIHLLSPIDMRCETLVTIEPRGVTFDGCRDPGVNLLFDPANLETPFQGGSPRGYAWKLRAK